jgi:integrase
MARKASGQVVELDRKRGRTFALRFRAYGRRHYLTLGTVEEGWSRQRAEEELQNVLADVRRGIWRRPEPASVATVADRGEPTFHEFASEWLDSRRPEWKPKTVKDYEWALSYHLLPFFAAHRLSQITIEEVDRYKSAKARERRIAPAQINKTLKRLAQILEVAEEYGHLERNPARGRRRRLKERKPQRSWVEPEQLLALISAADPWHRPVLATLAGTGLRVGEAVALNWRDVNLATGTITVGDSKTDAGSGRAVDLPLALREELSVHKAHSPRTRPDDPVFVSRPRHGRSARQTADNVGRRLKGAIGRANAQLDELGIESISERVSPHSLRRTYASLRAALGDDPVYIAEQLGHADFGFTFSVYQKAAKRRERLSGSYLEAFDRALEWALMGTKAVSAPARVESRVGMEASKTAS